MCGSLNKKHMKMKLLKDSKKVFAVSTLFLTAFVSYFYQNSNATTYAEITTQNIEALAQEDDDEVHLWCCGIVRICAKGDNVTILGKMKQSPCK